MASRQKEQDEQKLEIDKPMLAKAMKKIDICMMTTVGEVGRLHSRPMSNNRQVEWDGDTWFFAYGDSSQVQEIQRNANVNLAYAQPDDIVFISVTGQGEIVHDDEKKKEHWHKGLAMWFPNGPEDDAVVLIKVTGQLAYYWSKKGEGSLTL